MTKTSESVLFLFSPPMQACYSLSSAPTVVMSEAEMMGRRSQEWDSVNERSIYPRGYQQLDTLNERGGEAWGRENWRRGMCALHSHCGENESCYLLFCVSL